MKSSVNEGRKKSVHVVPSLPATLPVVWGSKIMAEIGAKLPILGPTKENHTRLVAVSGQCFHAVLRPHSVIRRIEEQ